MIEEQETQLKLIDIKNIFDFCQMTIAKEGLNAKFSYVIYKNRLALETPYDQIVQGIYQPENDPDYQKFIERQNRIIMKYIDRDEQGEMIFEQDGRTPRITEMIVEYQKENKKLIDDNVELLKTSEEKVAANRKFLEQEVTVKIYKISLDDIPDKAPPAIVGLLAIV